MRGAVAAHAVTRQTEWSGLDCMVYVCRGLYGLQDVFLKRCADGSRIVEKKLQRGFHFKREP